MKKRFKPIVALITILFITSCNKTINDKQYFLDNNLNYPVSFGEISNKTKVVNPNSEIPETEIETTQATILFYNFLKTNYTLDKCSVFNKKGVSFIFEKPFIYKEVNDRNYFAVKINCVVTINTYSKIPNITLEKYNIKILSNIALFSMKEGYLFEGWVF